MSQYNFKLDEQNPNIPKPKDFGSLLGAVQAKKVWYSKSIFWGSAVIATIALISTWALLHREIPSLKTKVKNRQISEPLEVHTKVVSDSSKIFSPTVTVYKTEVMKVNGTNDIANANEDLPSIKIQNIEVPPIIAYVPKQKPASVNFNWFTLPFDTFYILNPNKAGVLPLGNGNVVEYPADAWEDADGQLVTGPLQLLYRKSADQTSMIFSGIPFHFKKADFTPPMENNDCFKVEAMQNNKRLKIAKGTRLIFNFRVNNPSHSFSGLQYIQSPQTWDYMAFVDKPFVKGKQNDKTHSSQNQGSELVEKKGFWAWLKRIFKKPVYRDLQKDDRSNDTAQYHSSLGDNINLGFMDYPDTRTYEIRDLGWFGSGRQVSQKNCRSSNFRYKLNTKDSLNEGVYLVFLNRNEVVYLPGSGNATISVEKTDQCMLISFCKNKNYVGLLDANRFDREVKNILFMQKQNMRTSFDRDLILDYYNQPINNVDDLRKMIQSIGMPKKAS